MVPVSYKQTCILQANLYFTSKAKCYISKLSKDFIPSSFKDILVIFMCLINGGNLISRD